MDEEEGSGESEGCVILSLRDTSCLLEPIASSKRIKVDSSNLSGSAESVDLVFVVPGCVCVCVSIPVWRCLWSM